ncbi:MAG: hypothetical protein ACRC6X_09020 [Culicoidibacterales bacterium]
MAKPVKVKEYTKEEITAGGVIDVEKARESGYVTYAETANDIVTGKNKKARKYIDEHYTELEELAKKWITESIGRDVEIVGINGVFPYMAASIVFKTTEFPVIYERTSIGLVDNLEFEEGGYKGIDEVILHYRTVSELYMYAYEEELNELRAHFSQKYPQYMPTIIPSKDADYNSTGAPFITVGVVAPLGEKGVPYREKFLKGMYEKYWENPQMTRAELRELFEKEEKVYLTVDILVYEKDIAKIPTPEEAKLLQTDIMEYDFYWDNSNKRSVRVFLGTNLRKVKALEPLHRESIYA